MPASRSNGGRPIAGRGGRASAAAGGTTVPCGVSRAASSPPRRCPHPDLGRIELKRETDHALRPPWNHLRLMLLAREEIASGERLFWCTEPVRAPRTVAHDRRDAVRRGCRNRARATRALPAQWTPVWVGRRRERGRAAESLEAGDSGEPAAGRRLEHMFERVGVQPDGSKVNCSALATGRSSSSRPPVQLLNLLARSAPPGDRRALRSRSRGARRTRPPGLRRRGAARRG